MEDRQVSEVLEKLDLSQTVSQLRADYLMRRMVELTKEDRKAAMTGFAQYNIETDIARTIDTIFAFVQYTNLKLGFPSLQNAEPLTGRMFVRSSQDSMVCAHANAVTNVTSLFHARGRPTIKVFARRRVDQGLIAELFNLKIDLYEQAAQITEIGAGVTIWPRTWEILKSLGLANDLSVLLKEPRQMFKTEGLLSSCRPSDCASTTNSDFCQIHLSHRLERCEESVNSVKLIFENGLNTSCDVAIGADGIKALVNAVMYNGKSKHIVVYPINGGRLINIAAFISHPEDEGKTFKILLVGQFKIFSILSYALFPLKRRRRRAGNRGYLFDNLMQPNDPECLLRLIKVYDSIRRPFANHLQKNSRKQGYYNELNMPEFDDIQFEGQKLETQQIIALGSALRESWDSWWQDCALADLKQVIQILQAQTKI
ncbi:hypothetical protein DFJ43DRAFT_1044333 [Lentinula guzmanii]|uniref:FAD-binding domain-containing protein n=1 Tax=Lentinula guzmanii TaxID=2804957 RepID=A0AA38J7Y0_9AGAR|nr:hypothetical protein DFJ43DRAFT_1044333 [Lentinula guzmanii]